MAGKVKAMIDQIIDKRANGNDLIAHTTKTKLILKGVNVNNYTTTSDDDQAILDKLKSIASEWSISI